MGHLRLQVGFDAAHEQIGSSLREAKSDDSFDYKDKDRETSQMTPSGRNGVHTSTETFDC